MTHAGSQIQGALTKSVLPVQQATFFRAGLLGHEGHILRPGHLLKPRHGWFTNPGSDDDRCASEASGMVRKSSYVLKQNLVTIKLFL